MIFSSFQFLVFFACVLCLLALAPVRWRKLILLAVSYFFYAYWDYRFLSLMLASTIVDYSAAILLDRTTAPQKRRLLLLLSIVVNLTFLGFFKYFNFFIDSAERMFDLFGWQISTPLLYIILPPAISFYTFESMSYVIDIYRGKFRAHRSLLDFALFIAFFPKLVAGPIIRADDFFPQLARPVQIRADNLWAGAQIFVIGLFKKLMIANAVAPFVDAVFAYPDYYSSLTVWLAVIAYALQIYGDFSGYSDMAIGSARMMGFYLPRNFFMPYLSTNIGEFWRRWHISLSTWLRDYLYISLGGNRKGAIRTYINLMVTMILGGLWHGASWTFVLWGTVHGAALALHRFWEQKWRGPKLHPVAGWAATFLFVILAWVLFRSPDTQTMLSVYSKTFFINPDGAAWYYRAVFLAIAWTVIGHIAGRLRDADELVFFATPYSYRAAFATMIILLFIYIFAPTNISPFIYFQF